MNKHWTFKEFRESGQINTRGLYAVTYQRNDATNAVICEVLFWEPGPGKWYRYWPYESREEAGYLNTVNANDPVLSIRIPA